MKKLIFCSIYFLFIIFLVPTKYLQAHHTDVHGYHSGKHGVNNENKNNLSKKSIEFSRVEFHDLDETRIKEGAVDEDIFPRFKDHHYNPHTLESGKWDSINVNAVVASQDRWELMRQAFLVPGRRWNSDGSDNLWLEQQGSLHALGRVLHYLQDMAAPPHVHPKDGHGWYLKPGPGQEHKTYLFKGYYSDYEEKWSPSSSVYAEWPIPYDESHGTVTPNVAVSWATPSSIPYSKIDLESFNALRAKLTTIPNEELGTISGYMQALAWISYFHSSFYGQINKDENDPAPIMTSSGKTNVLQKMYTPDNNAHRISFKKGNIFNDFDDYWAIDGVGHYDRRYQYFPEDWWPCPATDKDVNSSYPVGHKSVGSSIEGRFYIYLHYYEGGENMPSNRATPPNFWPNNDPNSDDKELARYYGEVLLPLAARFGAGLIQEMFPAPENLELRYGLENGERFVYLDWDPPNDTVVGNPVSYIIEVADVNGIFFACISDYNGQDTFYKKIFEPEIYQYRVRAQWFEQEPITGVGITIHKGQPFPDTGQTLCYDSSNNGVSCDTIEPGDPFFGQDPHYQPRIPRSYTKLGYGGVELPDSALHEDDGGDWIMTRDNVTGLIWEIKTKANKDHMYTWANAQSQFIAGLNTNVFGGFDDWRLPDVRELSSLVNSDVPGGPILASINVLLHGAAIDKAWFPNTVSSDYLSATTSAYTKFSAWTVNYDNGYVAPRSKSSYSYYVRAVRAGSSPQPSFGDNKDGTVTDATTGLMWQKCSFGQEWDGNECTGSRVRQNWQQALEAAETSNWAGYDDWRLPNRNELQSLVDYSRYFPALDPLFVSSHIYWSSTTYAANLDAAWTVSSNDGRVLPSNKTHNYYVRAVRLGDSNNRSLTCGAPSSISVPSSSRTGSYTVSWGSSSTSGVTYVLQECTNSSFSSGCRIAYNGPSQSASITGRSSGNTHYYRVKATRSGYNDSGWRRGSNGCTVNIPTDLGSLRVTIEPSEARNAGAQWRRVGTSTWQSSGYIENNVPLGTQRVEFSNIAGWSKPSSQSMTIRKGQTTVIEQTYTEQAQWTGLPGVLMLLLDDDE